MNESHLLMLITGFAAGLMLAILLMLGTRGQASQPPIVVVPQREENTDLGCGTLFAALAILMMALVLFWIILSASGG